MNIPVWLIDFGKKMNKTASTDKFAEKVHNYLIASGKAMEEKGFYELLQHTKDRLNSDASLPEIRSTIDEWFRTQTISPYAKKEEERKIAATRAPQVSGSFISVPENTTKQKFSARFANTIDRSGVDSGSFQTVLAMVEDAHKVVLNSKQYSALKDYFNAKGLEKESDINRVAKNVSEWVKAHVIYRPNRKSSITEIPNNLITTKIKTQREQRAFIEQVKNEQGKQQDTWEDEQKQKGQHPKDEKTDKEEQKRTKDVAPKTKEIPWNKFASKSKISSQFLLLKKKAQERDPVLKYVKNRPSAVPKPEKGEEHPNLTSETLINEISKMEKSEKALQDIKKKNDALKIEIDALMKEKGITEKQKRIKERETRVKTDIKDIKESLLGEAVSELAMGSVSRYKQWCIAHVEDPKTVEPSGDEVIARAIADYGAEMDQKIKETRETLTEENSYIQELIALFPETKERIGKRAQLAGVIDWIKDKWNELTAFFQGADDKLNELDAMMMEAGEPAMAGKKTKGQLIPDAFEKGDKLKVSAYQSRSGEGLSYPDFNAIAMEDGWARGGWDVYDVKDAETDEEISIYGFSVEEVESTYVNEAMASLDKKAQEGIVPDKLSCGFAITSGNVDMIESNAEEDGIELDDAVWEKLNDYMIMIEDNVLKFLNTKGSARDEGHNDDELIGTFWPNDEFKADVEEVIDSGEPMRTSSGTLPFDPYEGLPLEDELVSLIDVDLDFFAADWMEKDDSKRSLAPEKEAGKVKGPGIPDGTGPRGGTPACPVTKDKDKDKDKKKLKEKKAKYYTEEELIAAMRDDPELKEFAIDDGVPPEAVGDKSNPEFLEWFNDNMHQVIDYLDEKPAPVTEPVDNMLQEQIAKKKMAQEYITEKLYTTPEEAQAGLSDHKSTTGDAEEYEISEDTEGGTGKFKIKKKDGTAMQQSATPTASIKKKASGLILTRKVNPDTGIKEYAYTTIDNPYKISKWMGTSKPKTAQEDEFKEGPSPDDYVMGDSGSSGAKTSVGRVEGGSNSFLGEFIETDDALRAIKENMEQEQYWPDVWQEDDHGGIENVSSWLKDI